MPRVRLLRPRVFEIVDGTGSEYRTRGTRREPLACGGDRIRGSYRGVGSARVPGRLDNRHRPGRAGPCLLILVGPFMSQPNEQYAYFAVTGQFDPHEITSRAGVGPNDSWRTGDLHPRTRLERTFSHWSLHSRLPRDEPLESHIKDVLDRLNQNREGFASLSRDYGGCMQLVGYFHEDYPGLHFDADLIAGLGKYGLSVDFDFYYLWSDRRKGT